MPFVGTIPILSDSKPIEPVKTSFSDYLGGVDPGAGSLYVSIIVNPTAKYKRLLFITGISVSVTRTAGGGIGILIDTVNGIDQNLFVFSSLSDKSYTVDFSTAPITVYGTLSFLNVTAITGQIYVTVVGYLVEL